MSPGAAVDCAVWLGGGGAVCPPARHEKGAPPPGTTRGEKELGECVHPRVPAAHVVPVGPGAAHVLSPPWAPPRAARPQWGGQPPAPPPRPRPPQRPQSRPSSAPTPRPCGWVDTWRKAPPPRHERWRGGRLGPLVGAPLPQPQCLAEVPGARAGRVWERRRAAHRRRPAPPPRGGLAPAHNRPPSPQVAQEPSPLAGAYHIHPLQAGPLGPARSGGQTVWAHASRVGAPPPAHPPSTATQAEAHPWRMRPPPPYGCRPAQASRVGGQRARQIQDRPLLRSPPWRQRAQRPQQMHAPPRNYRGAIGQAPRRARPPPRPYPGRT